MIRTAPIPENIASLMDTVLPEFTGMITQTPPVYSAIKVDGRRLYDYARKGDRVEVPSRQVPIHELEIESITDERVTFRVRCGKGTYIRTLGEDLAEACGTVGHLDALERIALGTWTLADALDLEADPEAFQNALMNARQALKDMPQIPVPEETARKIGFGQPFDLGDGATEVAKSGIGLALTESGLGLALVRMVDERAKVSEDLPIDGKKTWFSD